MYRFRRSLLALIVLAAVLGTPSGAGAVAGFGDVPTGWYYSRPVQWMVNEDITTGTSPCTFSPHEVVTRGQAAAFIWRMEGRPGTSSSHPFVDVTLSWQQDPISWMYGRGVTTGTTANTYSPEDQLTRGQFAALLYRLAGSPAVAPGFNFSDVPANAFYATAVRWMVQLGITTGTSPSTFSPNDPVTRAQAAAFLHRYKGSPSVAITTDNDCYILPGDGVWPQPPGTVGGRANLGCSDYDDFGRPWRIRNVDINCSGDNGLGPAEAGPGSMADSSVVVNGADNIKITEGGVYQNLWLRMSPTGGHIDAMQSQGNSDWLIDNVVIEIPSPHQGVTGAILIENLQGGRGGYHDVTGTINRVRLIGTGPYHHDIRLQNNPSASMTVTVTNIDWSLAHPDSVLLLSGSPSTLTVYVDDTVPPSRISGAQNATIIRI